MYHKKSDGDMGSLWLSDLSKQLVSESQPTLSILCHEWRGNAMWFTHLDTAYL